MHAVARILLDGVIHNVQVSWVKMGVEACQVILQGGANDFGGTLMEETISRMAGAEWGIRMLPHQFHSATEFYADYGVYDVSLTLRGRHQTTNAQTAQAAGDNTGGNDDCTIHAWVGGYGCRAVRDRGGGAGGEALSLRL